MTVGHGRLIPRAGEVALGETALCSRRWRGAQPQCRSCEPGDLGGPSKGIGIAGVVSTQDPRLWGGMSDGRKQRGVVSDGPVSDGGMYSTSGGSWKRRRAVARGRRERGMQYEMVWNEGHDLDTASPFTVASSSPATFSPIGTTRMAKAIAFSRDAFFAETKLGPSLHNPSRSGPPHGILPALAAACGEGSIIARGWAVLAALGRRGASTLVTPGLQRLTTRAVRQACAKQLHGPALRYP